MDSWSVRAAWQPSPSWSLQASRGDLESPEQLEPEVDTVRTTASAIYGLPLAGGHWQTTLAWGRNEPDPGPTTDSLLLESAATHGRHTLFGRAEHQENGELFGHGGGGSEGPGEEAAGGVFEVGKLSLGYLYDFLERGSLRVGAGAVGSLASIPGDLEALYGASPLSWMVFLRARI